MRLQVSSNNLSHSKFKFIITKPNLQNKFQNPEKKREKRRDDPCFIFSKTLLPTRFLRIFVFLRCF
ncbi:hypothetical protein HanXRQr2_Chr10g0462681 [Helianthus annuus]|uniref:Uncharacterized protein n=1 Tax=Helianthus annuus TaxID=4232 RepID=A0A251TPG0_HELAN|nr:hypothetical protein HanXRQr2_Chr10g0462681 [Helianthus annuus]KAJ0885552.1 hypothetical protein HanPSC8_Chr10g0446501 [Helianthus annuus]